MGDIQNETDYNKFNRAMTQKQIIKGAATIDHSTTQL